MHGCGPPGTEFDTPGVCTIYIGANKYLIHCLFFKFSHLQRMERSVIFIVGTPQP